VRNVGYKLDQQVADATAKAATSKDAATSEDRADAELV
jgi:hypothetical protein